MDEQRMFAETWEKGLVAQETAGTAMDKRSGGGGILREDVM